MPHLQISTKSLKPAETLSKKTSRMKSSCARALRPSTGCNSRWNPTGTEGLSHAFDEIWMSRMLSTLQKLRGHRVRNKPLGIRLVGHKPSFRTYTKSMKQSCSAYEPSVRTYAR